MDAPAVSCTPKQIDLQALFVTSVTAQYNRCYHLAIPESVLTKQI